MTTTLLIDADIVGYKFAAAGQTGVDWDGDGEKSLIVDDFPQVAAEVDSYLSQLYVQLQADRMIICLSCPSAENFRLKVLPSYKENRKDVKKPVHLSAIRSYLSLHYETYQKPTLEADDVMGILSTHPTLIKGKKIIVSEDKDMKTIPGWLYNPRKDEYPRLISQSAADYWHLYQTLVGDTTDNYKGCPKVGHAGAEKLLNEEQSWDAVKWMYHCKGLTEEDALVQARVARICRYEDYDYSKKGVILWQPPKT
jgi:DNA polymerase-1